MTLPHPSDYVEPDPSCADSRGLRISQDGSPVLQAGIRKQLRRESREALYVDYTDPITLLNFSSKNGTKQARDVFCYTMYELLNMQEKTPDILLASLVAVQFDGAMRDMFYECGEKPVYAGYFPDQVYYRYQKRTH